MTPEEFLAKWQKETCRAQTAHFHSATRLERMKYRLGIIVIVLTTFVGSSLFATLQRETDIRIKIAIAVASICSAILASIQTFLSHAERADKHRLAAVRYGALKKEIELIQTAIPKNSDEWRSISTSLLDRRNQLSEDSPTIPAQIWAHIPETGSD